MLIGFAFADVIVRLFLQKISVQCLVRQLVSIFFFIVIAHYKKTEKAVMIPLLQKPVKSRLTELWVTDT